MNKKLLIPIVVLLLLILIIVFAFIFSSNDDGAPNESVPTSIIEVHSSEPDPVVSEQPPELIVIDNTPADVYVDIEAGANNPANNLPWVDSNLPIWDSDSGVTAIAFAEVDLSDNEATPHVIGGFTWNEILQVEPDSLQIGQGFTYELQNFPQRKIQNRDAARIVANEIIEYLGLSEIAVMRIIHDSDANIWIVSFGNPVPTIGMAGMWSSYAINGYNSQVIRAWIH